MKKVFLSLMTIGLSICHVSSVFAMQKTHF